MKVKNSNPYDLIEGKGLKIILEVFYQINFLKSLYRQGWLRHIDEKECESVADHVFSVTILVILINDVYDLGFDVSKILIMSLFHEMGEIKTGDITPFDGISKEEKHRMEKAAVIDLFKDLPGGEKYIEIWEEFDQKETVEAKFVHQVEKLEMAIQADIYSGLHKKDLSEFNVYVEKLLSNNLLKELLNELEY